MTMSSPARSEFRGFKAEGSGNIEQIAWFPGPPKTAARNDAPVFTGIPDVGTLGVNFRNGATYTYTDVPLEVYLQLLAASSVGQAFDRLIKKAAFKYQRVFPAGE